MYLNHQVFNPKKDAAQLKALKEIKLVALDLDGTLLDDHLHLSGRTVQTINQLVGQGIQVVFISGRTYRAVALIKSRLSVEIPLVAYNGGRVVMPPKGPVYSVKIPLKEAKRVIQYGEENNLYVKVYIDDVLYVSEDDEASREFSISNGIDYQVVGQLSQGINQDVNMIVLYYPEEIYGRVDPGLKDIDVTITMSTTNSLDVIPKGVAKDQGLRLLARELRVSSESILAVGNSMNDLEMLRYVGLGIAMKNADERLLRQWPLISQYTNNEEGVYHILKYLL